MHLWDKSETSWLLVHFEERLHMAREEDQENINGEYVYETLNYNYYHF